VPPGDQGGKHDKSDQECAGGTLEGGAVAEIRLAPTRIGAYTANRVSMTTILANIRNTASGHNDCV